MEEQNEECRAIVLEYLLHYCYKNSAKALLKEMRNLDNCAEELQAKDTNEKEIDSRINFKSNQTSACERSISWASVDARKDIYNAIKIGDIGRAFAIIEQCFPDLIRTYNTVNILDKCEKPISSPPRLHHILYKLRCQQFIEALRSSGEIEAIQFAQYYLRPCHKLYPDLTNSVTTLIAYEDLLENEKTKHLLSQQRRDDIADEINEMILESQHYSPKTTLEKLWRQKTVVQVELDSQVRKEMLENLKEVDNLEKVPM